MMQEDEHSRLSVGQIEFALDFGHELLHPSLFCENLIIDWLLQDTWPGLKVRHLYSLLFQKFL